MSFSTQKLHFSIKIPIQNYKQPNQTFTNDRTKSPQTTEKPKKIWTIQYKSNTLANTIDTTKMKKPSFKMVLTAVGPYAYQRPDGIFVVPIGCLKD